MVKAKTKKEEGSFSDTVVKIMNSIFTGFKPVVERIETDIEDHIEKIVRRVLKHNLIYLAMFMSFTFFILGLFFLLIDYCGVPRGIVFTGGGLLGLVLFGLLNQIVKL